MTVPVHRTGLRVLAVDVLGAVLTRAKPCAAVLRQR